MEQSINIPKSQVMSLSDLEHNMLIQNNPNVLLKKLCELTVPGLLKNIQCNLTRIINSPYNNSSSIIKFYQYYNFGLLDIGLYEDLKQKEYIDVIVKYKDEKMTDFIYIRWEEEFNDNYDINEKYDIKEIPNDEKEKIIKELVMNFIKKFMSGKIFKSLNELYMYLKFNCFNRDNRIIKRKLNIIPKKIEEIIISQNKTNVLELIELMDLRISYNEIFELDNYLSDIFKKKRPSVQIERFRTNFTIKEYSWEEVGSLEIYIRHWAKKLHLL